ncbi:hypothetical protein PSEUDO8O_120486 [Pseudomonas sp. 8O]|nr:hypothetical protein PSEUDO8O_120486 [Pseudomonas sp. 8O]
MVMELTAAHVAAGLEGVLAFFFAQALLMLGALAYRRDKTGGNLSAVHLLQMRLDLAHSHTVCVQRENLEGEPRP